MYTSKNTMSEILRLFPEFQETWVKHLKYWEGDDEREIGIDITEFSSFISNKLKEKCVYNFKEVFNFIEVLIVDGDEEVTYAAEFQFLEILLNMSSHGDFPIESFFPYLGTESKKFCKLNEEFWGIEDSKFYKDK